MSRVIVSKPDLEWRSLRERVSFFVGAFGEHLITCEGCAAWPSQTLVRHLTRRLQRRKAVSGRGLEQLLVLQAVRHPRRRLQPFRLYRPTVHAALAERAGVDPSQGVAHLGQDGRIELRFGEALARVFIGDARIPRIRDARSALRAAPFSFLRRPGHEMPFELEESLFVLRVVHEHLL